VLLCGRHDVRPETTPHARVDLCWARAVIEFSGHRVLRREGERRRQGQRRQEGSWREGANKRSRKIHRAITTRGVNAWAMAARLRYVQMVGSTHRRIGLKNIAEGLQFYRSSPSVMIGQGQAAGRTLGEWT
jgi:hypothetical protein